MEHYGQLTDKLQKPLKGVPTIVFDGQYKEEDSKLAQINFVKAFCQYVKGAKPAECAKNSGSPLHFQYLTIIVGVLVSKIVW